MTARQGAIADIEARPPALSAPIDELTGTLLVPPGARALLTTEPGRSAVAPRRLETGDPGEFRAWLDLPAAEPLERWTDERGRLVAALYALGDVTVAADASLVVRGAPAILRFRSLTVHESGRLVVYTPCSGRFGRLEKRGGEVTG